MSLPTLRLRRPLQAGWLRLFGYPTHTEGAHVYDTTQIKLGVAVPITQDGVVLGRIVELSRSTDAIWGLVEIGAGS